MLVADELRHLQAGTESQMLLLHEGLTAAGWHSELTVLRRSESVREQWPGPVRDLNIFRILSFGAFWRAWRFARRLRQEGFSVAHIYFNDAAVLLPFFLRLSGLKVVVSRRDMGFWYTPRTLLALRFVRRFVDSVVANCKAVACNVAREERFDSEQIRVIYNGVSCPHYGEVGKAALQQEPVIGVVANIRPIKRLEDAIAAFARISDKHGGAILEIVGGGDSGPLQAQAAELGIVNRIRFVGRVTDIRSRLHRYAVCILTSESEGLSNALIEYMLSGCAIVCSDTGGNSELVVDGASGFLYPVGDTVTLARKIDQLLSDSRLREAMGEAARMRAESMTQLSAMVDGHTTLYTRLLDKQGCVKSVG